MAEQPGLEYSVSPGFVVGLGGTGDWILSLLKRQLYINYGLVSDEASMVQFLLLDTLATDSWEKEKYKTTEGFQVKKTEYIHLKEPPGGFYKWAEDPKNYKNEAYGWFRRNVFKADYNREADWTLNKGAGQLRQFARMGLFFNFDQVYQAIFQGLKAIHEARGQDEIPVWFVGSVAGGTGSGLLMDLAALTRLIADEQGFTVRTIGGIVLPDVYAEATAEKEQGYAAIRELNRFTAKVNIEDQALDHRSGNTGNYSHRFLFRHNKIYHQKSSIFDNLVFFNETCKNDQERKSYFNKIVDGITVLFDRAGAHEFYQRVINANEEKITDFSTYRIFIPIRLYEQKFKYKHLLKILDELFPIEPNLTIQKPEPERALDIHNRVNAFLDKLAPYFSFLQTFKNDDARIEEFAREFRGKPQAILDRLLGFNNPTVHYSNPEMTPNQKAAQKQLCEAVLAEYEPPPRNEIKKDCEEARASYKADIDREYGRYMDHVLAGATEQVLEVIKENFHGQLCHYMANNFPREYGVREFNYFLNHLFETLQGKDPENPSDITAVIEQSYQKHFHKHVTQMNGEVQKELLAYEKAEPQSRFMRKDYGPVLEAMTTYKEFKERELLFRQSFCAMEMLRDAHRMFSDLVLKLRRQLEDRNQKISINQDSLRTRFGSERNSIEGILEMAGGRFSSIGLKSLNHTDYELYLEEKLFSEKPYVNFQVDFDGSKFRIVYNQNDQAYTDKDHSFWVRVEEDIEKHITQRMVNFEGIIHYLKWAKRGFEEKNKGGDFAPELLSSFKDAQSSSQQALNDKGLFQGRLIHGDENLKDPANKDMKEIFDNLENQLASTTGVSSEENLKDKTSGKFAFSDKNSLIYLISSNALDPRAIPVIQNMEQQYKRYLIERHVPWRARVYHNYKCDWVMWEIERSIMTGQTQQAANLTSGCFYWVLEEDQMVELFVQAMAAGVIRQEIYRTRGKIWVCGNPQITYKDNEHDQEVILLTGWDGDRNQVREDLCLFHALVSFAINRKEAMSHSIKEVYPDQIENWIEQSVEARGGWAEPVKALVEEMGLNDVKSYNPPGLLSQYEDHKSLFLNRVFKYYLDQLR